MNNYLRISKCHRPHRPVPITNPSINGWDYINMKSCQSITVQVLTQYCFPFQSITIYCNSLHFSAEMKICHAAHLLINMEDKWSATICDLKIYHESTSCNKFKNKMSHFREPSSTEQNCIKRFSARSPEAWSCSSCWLRTETQRGCFSFFVSVSEEVITCMSSGITEVPTLLWHFSAWVVNLSNFHADATLLYIVCRKCQLAMTQQDLWQMNEPQSDL